MRVVEQRDPVRHRGPQQSGVLVSRQDDVHLIKRLDRIEATLDRVTIQLSEQATMVSQNSVDIARLGGKISDLETLTSKLNTNYTRMAGASTVIVSLVVLFKDILFAFIS